MSVFLRLLALVGMSCFASCGSDSPNNREEVDATPTVDGSDEQRGCDEELILQLEILDSVTESGVVAANLLVRESDVTASSAPNGRAQIAICLEGEQNTLIIEKDNYLTRTEFVTSAAIRRHFASSAAYRIFMFTAAAANALSPIPRKAATTEVYLDVRSYPGAEAALGVTAELTGNAESSFVFDSESNLIPNSTTIENSRIYNRNVSGTSTSIRISGASNCNLPRSLLLAPGGITGTLIACDAVSSQTFPQPIPLLKLKH